MRAGLAIAPSMLLSVAVLPILAAVVIALVVLAVVSTTFKLVQRFAHRSALVADMAHRAHLPTQSFLAVTAARILLDLWHTHEMNAARSVDATTADQAAAIWPWLDTVQHVLKLAQIATGAWLVASLLLALVDAALARFRLDVADNLEARRLHTQIALMRRMTMAIIAILTVGAMLYTFPAARAAGTGVIASAGLVGVVTALAAQSLLGNLFAGFQLAFGDALRLDDVVVVEGEWGRIEEMTLSYVVVKIWDERRLILPASYFSSKPFQNWTRTDSAVLGTIYFDVDWSLPLDEMRAELVRVVHASDLWDGRVCSLIVTDATGGMVQVRALISAADSSKQWDLRCLVREALVTWVRTQHPESLPRMRADLNVPHQAGRGGPGAAILDGQIPAPTRPL